MTLSNTMPPSNNDPQPPRSTPQQAGSGLSMAKLPQAFRDALSAEFPADFCTTAPDPDTCATYGRDWTRVHPARPAAVAFPRTTEEVSRLLQLCHAHDIAVVPSGGRTGLAGGAVAATGELVLSLERMRTMHSVDVGARTVRVQAGAITASVHAHTQAHGLTWPVDFASSGSSQIGGNIATNAGGVRVVRYGLTRQWVLGLQVVLMDGTVLELNGALEKNNTGFDLRQLIIGSEGTLAVITEATLKLAPLPRSATQVAMLGVDGLAGALELFAHAQKCPAFELQAFEFLTRPCLDVTVAERAGGMPFDADAPAYVLLEMEPCGAATPSDAPADGDHQGPSDNTQSIEAWLEAVFEQALVQDGAIAQSSKESQALWALREGMGEALAKRGFLHKNDVALPVAALPAFLAAAEAMFAKEYTDFDVFVFGHVGDGNLHINIMKPAAMDQDAFVAGCHQADQSLFALVQEHQGSVSAEHGIGLLKKEALHFSRTPTELALFRGIKQVFDPKGLLNPGKIFDSEESSS